MQSLRRIHATCLRVYARIYTDRGTVYCLALVVQFLLKSCFFSSYLCKVSYFTPGGLCRFGISSLQSTVLDSPKIGTEPPLTLTHRRAGATAAPIP